MMEAKGPADIAPCKVIVNINSVTAMKVLQPENANPKVIMPAPIVPVKKSWFTYLVPIFMS